jgi:hypothetical protein
MLFECKKGSARQVVATAMHKMLIFFGAVPFPGTKDVTQNNKKNILNEAPAQDVSDDGGVN